MQHTYSLFQHTLSCSHASYDYLYTQPIISSSCLFNLRAAPYVTVQVVSPHSPPLSHKFTHTCSEYFHQSLLKSHSFFYLIHLCLDRKKDRRRDRRGSEYVKSWRTDSCKDNVHHVFLWWSDPVENPIQKVFKISSLSIEEWCQFLLLTQSGDPQVSRRKQCVNACGMRLIEHVWSLKNELVHSLLGWWGNEEWEEHHPNSY